MLTEIQRQMYTETQSKRGARPCMDACPWTNVYASLLIATLFLSLVVGCQKATQRTESNNEAVLNSGQANSEPNGTSLESLFSQRVIAASLPTPAGVAIQPGTGDILVSTTGGVLRLDSDQDYRIHKEIIGFGQDSFGNGPAYSFGPLGLAFSDSLTLFVGGGGQKDGKDVVNSYRVNTEPMETPTQQSKPLKSYGTIVAGEKSFRGEGNFFGMHFHDGKVYCTSHGDDTKGWMSIVDPENPDAGIQPVLASKAATSTDGPSAIAVLPNGKLLIAQTGELHESPDSVLSIFDLNTFKLEKKLELGLYDITAIVIDPASGELFVTDFAWAKPDSGGLFEVDLKTGKTIKRASLTHPTAVVLDANGQWVVACICDQNENPKPVGQIILLSRNEEIKNRNP